jgi:hypothetical protein
MATCVDAEVVVVCGLSPGGHPCPPYIGRRTRSLDRSPGRLQQGNLSLVCLHHGRLIGAALIRLDCLVFYPKLSSCLRNLLEGLQEVVWAANEVGWAH